MVALSLVLIGFDRGQENLARLRTGLSIMVTPIQYLVDLPKQTFDSLQTNLTSRKTLLEENAALRTEQMLLKVEVQKLVALKKENAELRALLKSSPTVEGNVLVAELLAVDIDPFSQKVLINKGGRDGIFVGQAVLDASGVVGQVVNVTPFSSHVLLLTDSRSAIPAEINRNGMRTIVIGTGDPNILQLLDVSKTTDIKEGDVLVTSGLGKGFPAGYPIGKVLQVNHHSGDSFARIYIQPMAQLNRSRLVLLVWPPTSSEQKKL